MAIWQDPKTLALWITIVLLLVAVLGVSLVFFVRIHFRRMLKAQAELNQVQLEHERQLLHDSVEVQERERNRIASDLHDELIGKLTVLALEVGAETNSSEQVRQKLTQSIQVARRISHDLSPPLLEQTSFEEAMDALFHPLKSHFSVEYHQHISANLNLPTKIKLQLLRIVQEVINNSIKHAEAKHITAAVHIGQQYLAIQIADDGCGFDPTNKAGGLGLRNIALRTELLGGNYRFRNAVPASGTIFTLVLNHKNATETLSDHD